MNISALLSALKVINEVMKLLNDIEVHMLVCYHYTYNIYIMLAFLNILYPCP